MKAIIIDDERNGRIALKQKVQDYCPEVQVIGEAENGRLGIDLIKRLDPQLVFLDIEMPGLTGLDVAQFYRLV